jgi:glycosyltransferase involved in cell wall biosynthesis
MRLCIATSSYPSDSENSFAGVFVRDFARALVRRGVEVSIFSQDTGHPPLRDDGIGVITFPWPGRATPLSSLKPFHPLDALKIILLLRRGSKRLIQHCRQKKIDFLLAMWTLPAGHWGMEAYRSLGVPFAVWSLGSDIWVYGRLPILKAWVRRILKQSRYCFADGFSLVNEVRALTGRSCSFLPTTRVLPKEGLPNLALSMDHKHFLFIGRYHENKGPDILLDAIHLIERQTLSKMRFHFFGTGPLERDLKRKVNQYGLKKEVAIEGPVDEYRMAALLKECDTLIIPSRVESIPVVLSDALQVGCNVIVSDVGDMGPLVRFYQAGIVVDELSPEAFEKAILGQLERKKDEFQKGRQKLYALFDLEKGVDTFLKSVRAKGEGHFERLEHE